MANEANGTLRLTFEISSEGNPVRTEEVSAESVTIGRGPAAMIRIENDGLADLHAVVNTTDDGGLQLLDLGSATGTQINGEKVAGNATLASGDSIGIGGITIVLTFEAVGEAVEESTQPVPDEQDEAESTDQVPESIVAAAAAEDGNPSIADSGEDVMAFIMRSGTASSDAGVDRKKAKVLEVAEIWSDTVIDVKHYPKGAERVPIGSSTGYRWRFVGLPMGWVPPRFARFAWLLAPTLSEATEERRNDFYVPPEDLPNDDYVLFEEAGGHYVFNMNDSWSGFVDIGDQRHTFQDVIESGVATSTGAGQYQVPVNDDTRIVADLGNVIFFSQMVAPGIRVAKAKSDRDPLFVGLMSFMSFILAMIFVIFLNSPPPSESEIVEVPDRFVEMLLEQPEPEPQKEKNKPDANPDAGEGAKAKKEEGKVGKKDAKMEKAKGNKVELQKKKLDTEVAENAGVLGALRDGGELDGVFGSSNLSSDLAGGIGGLIGAKGTQIGSGGLGARGSGLGGGGTAAGLGGLGTKGRGSGKSGYGSGGGNFGAKGEGGIGRIGGDPIILGALDKSLIDAVIKKHMNQIRYCYQRELPKNPSLAGKVTVKFVISKTGSVSKASTKTSTLANKAVEGCINSRFMRFKFPEPKGGGIVIVSYPFIFQPS
ncbi:MAG: AgmX/PglI C-terminal domain-containing protein [Myxococcota bacterium]|nr:AgmX/PglI C-terminal domain-containing protein [Myxococcota bacterium]